MSDRESRADGGAAQGDEQHLRRAVAERDARLAECAGWAARVPHEINTPLTGLIGQAQLLLREELSDAARRRVQTIEHLANRIRDTVASLREIQTPLPRPLPGDTTPPPPRPPGRPPQSPPPPLKTSETKRKASNAFKRDARRG